MDEQRKSSSDLSSIKREPRGEYGHTREERSTPRQEYTREEYSTPRQEYRREEYSTPRQEYRREEYSAPRQEYAEEIRSVRAPRAEGQYVPRRSVARDVAHAKPQPVQHMEYDAYEEEEFEPQTDKKGRFGKGKKRKPLNPHLRRFRFFIILVVLSLIACYASFITMSEFMQDSGKETVLTGIEVEIVIPEGASTIAIAEILKENQLINDTWIFRIKSRIDGYDGTFKQGTYHIDTGLTSEEIMEMLQNGVVYDGDVKFTIPEGYNTLQIAEKLESEGICTTEEFIAAANEDVYDYDFLEGLPDRDYRLEGYLFPNTYYITDDATAYDVVTVMLDGFDAMYNEAYRELVAQGEYTLDEYVTMASIIEKEIAVADERAIASGVIRNRLESGMPLQMDATVLYAMGIIKEDVTYTDLEVDSPYNTYKVTGLPIGPISNPGASSFEAALYPEDHNYIYYVVEAKGQSNHLYFENYDDFLVAKNNYQNS
ncbi:endolytic transglycosylase MltG [Chakrabartyella piscis]|uniref:endolytic transglycosylase MltG n=1 Tax=Chakrabartyella piscis TaxID=2918914 RepID=UPI002958AA07|nr:endolytic transglycosylase MltG [Chakrabartyella piscis]